VVDDEKDIVDLVTLHLQREGHEVLSIGNGLGVLPLAVQHEPDLIVLDLMLPGLDGVQVHRRLRGDSRTRHIPVIMLTARSQTNDRIAGLESRPPLSPFPVPPMTPPAKSKFLSDVVRGVRDGTDLEAELRYARFLGELRPETNVVWIGCEAELQHLGSSAIRELEAIAVGSGSRYVPDTAGVYGLVGDGH